LIHLFGRVALGGSKPRANAAAPTAGGFFMTTKPAFSRWATTRSAIRHAWFVL
jgi:hypothetical protein